MKLLKKTIYTFLLVMILFVISPSIISIPGQINNVEAAVKINKKKVTLIKGQTTTLKISGTKKKAKWSSSKKSVATVSSKGKVTAKKKGTATITAKIGNKKYTCKVTVQTPKISSSKITLSVGETSKLKVNGTDQKITWKSSNKKIATIDKNGKVTGKKAGSVKITATVLKKKYICNVTIKNKKSFSEKEALKMVSIKQTVQEDCISFRLKNNYYYAIDPYVKVLFYNSDGQVIDYDVDSCHCMNVGDEMILLVWIPEDLNGNPIKYSYFKCKWEIADASYNKGEKELIYNSYYGNDNIIVEIKNNSKYEVSSGITVIMYTNGKINPWSSGHDIFLYPGETIYEKFSLPYDNEFDIMIKPDYYEIFIG